jgi:hypothetical protein
MNQKVTIESDGNASDDEAEPELDQKREKPLEYQHNRLFRSKSRNTNEGNKSNNRCNFSFLKIFEN